MANFFDLKARKAAASAGASSKGTQKADRSSLQPWVEKYRPKSLSEVTAQDHTISVLQRTMQASNLPHMLFYGPPGTGKTSTILALAKQLYGPELFRSRVLELNASDERGIAIVREKVKDFARQQLSNPPSGPAGVEYRKRYPCPPFKIIVLDEADSMTQDAQSALRRTMETYSKITRFCLVCNYVTRIIDPLASRCSKFRFKSLDHKNASQRLKDIAGTEGIRVGDGAVDALVKCSEGDLRRAITYLQSAARLVVPTKQAAKGEDEMDIDDAEGSQLVTVTIVEEIAGIIPGQTIESLLNAMRPMPKKQAYDSIATVVQDLISDGWSASQLLNQMYEKVLFDERIADIQKQTIAIVFSETDKRLVDGADEHLEVLDLALKVSECMA
ncbi:P-loop containing nucleoside triphosphate hydrolase protein [Eremomyces bilateralis CBS 781.70]|uniref:Replication factor C subunit 2 n=1 Tax=Eremomyces bilateralis CBS 781.70 TaxID=1392243 RepID=A0A6G1G7S8_9PEZI|nr:P-loop containing nucleoside triphosphate hydrolase protein [Eremomyces bilateralis CBS 781.70]KAF1814093.1 P-loop containing nucleoside triphosphate hydrolase protein [Eremomyces bilateralis CBS 781.70]